MMFGLVKNGYVYGGGWKEMLLRLDSSGLVFVSLPVTGKESKVKQCFLGGER